MVATCARWRVGSNSWEKTLELDSEEYDVVGKSMRLYEVLRYE
jgi:hypothetical protein